MLTKQKKERIIEKFRTHKSDTGSAEVQIAILTAEIKELSKHLKDHRKDFSSRRGLLRKVSQRRRLLRYLHKENEKSFTKLIKILKLKMPRVDQAPGAIIIEEVLAAETADTPAVAEEAVKTEKPEKPEKTE
ncbi:MAG: 30S ribosomal protein S15 [Candidatus Komeilibacteria bacterium RIFCSPLOWO2_01_FULL_52_15]|uniref:Small ribosomal subunit protein uS15 n=2 Tax=Candidatus Komeiliibacteriota TaxID=1817908 RepID=A0A1G2BSA8_9BACT|nr:MAG: 30S ribosomal protein S15 [Candidatus Komeilibacteria bacterium RIFCSPHIGHO2_01_FULL_52_14]OGY91898.1 MAG: 30S ribosomal protein S15 [Candidatus Komeilibacteria bacterium RIFCSPLOWO2_01_FULL_52_15]